MELKDLVNPVIVFLFQMTLLKRLTFLLGSLLNLFLSSDASICSTMVFPPLEYSDYVAISVSVNFALNSKRDTPFHRMVYDHSCSYCDGLRDHLRDVP